MYEFATGHWLFQPEDVTLKQYGIQEGLNGLNGKETHINCLQQRRRRSFCLRQDYAVVAGSQRPRAPEAPLDPAFETCEAVRTSPTLRDRVSLACTQLLSYFTAKLVMSYKAILTVVSSMYM